jgi:hypothetical protein
MPQPFPKPDADVVGHTRIMSVGFGGRYTGRIVRGVSTKHGSAVQALIVDVRLSDDLKIIEGTVAVETTSGKDKSAVKILARAPGSNGAEHFYLMRLR